MTLMKKKKMKNKLNSFVFCPITVKIHTASNLERLHIPYIIQMQTMLICLLKKKKIRHNNKVLTKIFPCERNVLSLSQII